MDALFGLPRKKAAGDSLRPPLHGHLFFEDQDIVDEYVNSASKMKSSSTKVYILLQCMYISMACSL